MPFEYTSYFYDEKLVKKRKEKLEKYKKMGLSYNKILKLMNAKTI